MLIVQVPHFKNLAKSKFSFLMSNLHDVGLWEPYSIKFSFSVKNCREIVYWDTQQRHNEQTIFLSLFYGISVINHHFRILRPFCCCSHSLLPSHSNQQKVNRQRNNRISSNKLPREMSLGTSECDSTLCMVPTHLKIFITATTTATIWSNVKKTTMSRSRTIKRTQFTRSTMCNVTISSNSFVLWFEQSNRTVYAPMLRVNSFIALRFDRSLWIFQSGPAVWTLCWAIESSALGT